MEHNEFIERLKELAEVKAIRPAKTAAFREAAETEVIERQGEVFELDKDSNQTWAYEVKKLKNTVRKCDYCDDLVKNQVINKRVLFHPEPHWRETCNSCKMTRNPETGKFDIKDIKVAAFFITYFSKRNK